MSIEIVCSKCNNTLYRIKQLRPVKDIIKKNNRCPNCDAALTTDFVLSIERF